MPALTQLSLTLKLSDMIPLGSLVSVSGDALVKYAREVQNSGSDLVTEQDLQRLFGRALVDRALGAAFKQRIRKATTFHKILDLVSLEAGAGPTVRSAFTTNSDAGAFAMVVQLSFLSSVHKLDCLAEAISAYFQTLALQDSSQDADEAPLPDEDRIRGVLTTCQEQTVAWDWQQFLYTVADQLRSFTGDQMDWVFASESIDGELLHGLIQFLPLVQRFPTQYRPEIHSPRGICAIIVWAYYILGIHVHVRGKASVIRFPESSKRPSIVLVMRSQLPDKFNPIVLFEKVDGNAETPFHIERERDFVRLDSISTSRAKGIGTRWLRRLCGPAAGSESVVIELTLMICGLALHVVDHLLYVRDHGVASDNTRRPLVKQSVFMDAAKFLFSHEAMRSTNLFTMKSMNDRRYLARNLQHTPKMIQAHLQTYETPESEWSSFYGAMRVLAITLLAFCHVRDLEACDDLIFLDNQEFSLSPLSRDLSVWDGMSDISIEPGTWFGILQERIDEECDGDPSRGMALVSRRGWSIYVDTFGLPDPALIDVGAITIHEGVPSRHGVRKHNISFGGADAEPEYEAGYFDTVDKLRPMFAWPKKPLLEVKRLSTLISQPRDSFFVRLQLQHHASFSDPSVTETSHRHLWDSLWCVHKTESCSHEPSEVTELRLDSDEAVAQDYGGILQDNMLPDSMASVRVLIFPTVGHAMSRYFALFWLYQNVGVLPVSILLRTKDCCVQCAISQTLKREGTWCIVT